MRLKKWFGAVTATVLALSLMLAGCGGKTGTGGNEGNAPTNTENTTSAPKETVTLKAYFPGDKPAGFDDVLQAVNDKLKADNVGAALNINFLPWSDYGNAVSVKMSAGEDFDMYLDAPWLSMNQMIASNSLLELDAMVAERLELKASIPDEMWEYNKFDGKIMGIPLGTTQGPVYGLLIRKDLREKYGLPELKTLEDLEKFLYTVKENEKDVRPFVINGIKADKLPFILSESANLALDEVLEIGVSMFSYSTKDKKVVGQWASPMIADGYERVTKYYKDGIISKNIAQEQNAETLFKQGKYAATYYAADGVEGLKYSDMLKDGSDKLEVFVPNGDKAGPYTAFQQWNFLCIPTSSKHSDLALDVVNWLSIKENHDLMEYGIQGKDWEPAGDTSYKALSNYSFPGFVLTWRPTLNRTPDTMMPDDKKWFDFSADPANFTLSPTAGFSFNAEKVKTEYAKITPLHDSFFLPLSQGVLSADEGKATLEEKMASLGGQKVIDEIQAQIDAVTSGK
ncbi:extracellular solute-binding protein [Paenibacillus macerans]|uniref:Bacterial extracellular solute-binding family protein n=1 Tax=Paenibacillus macerans TaxID=44252 RepID=A0A090ZNT4_PAEMA|nr:extracellular solute-binding protein [Paenibacillus macerans]KFN12277.1 bacterial extracellular solute-binding family protein [Paenibacillus macerans]MBS5911731.1 extracellular solute-binding protein [Paenibacillus macerans]MCY7558361.1 extracellular solute-binding protein [Paenibacillus macerans]MEC0138901.1 extracellular solute-binding protein [Paenibacillus macerans]MEC0150346.1 extracellular solute-binding protein [Paenibacillus macerans]